MTLEYSAQALVARLGETDQQFLSDPTPQLAIERAEIRMALAHYSHRQGEQLHFLNEAAVILELAAVEVEDRPTHLALSIQLSLVYLQHFEVTQELRYLIVTGQILRTQTSLMHPMVFLGLARADAGQQKLALTRHWLEQWQKSLGDAVRSQVLSYEQLQQQIAGLPRYAEFSLVLHEAWFQDIVTAAGLTLAECLPTPASPVHS